MVDIVANGKACEFLQLDMKSTTDTDNMTLCINGGGQRPDIDQTHLALQESTSGSGE